MWSQKLVLDLLKLFQLNARTQETRKLPVLLRSQLYQNPNQLWRLKLVNLKLVNLKLVSKPVTSKPGTTQGENSSKNNSSGAMDFATLMNKQIEEFRNMMISNQQQMVVWLEQIQTQNKNRFTKIEAELSSFIPAVNQRFREVERRVDKEETSSQASVTEIEK